MTYKARQSVIIIPVLNPHNSLIDYIKLLIDFGFEKIIVINDGSLKSTENIFSEIKMIKECDVLVHYKNFGKGRALKSALNHYLNEYSEFYENIITVDADGQHSIKDVLKLEETLSQHPEYDVVLGSRNFTRKDTPLKSWLGNLLTRKIYGFLYGLKIKDSQTGLRGFQNRILSKLLDLDGERYDYEMHVLVHIALMKNIMHEVDIETIYINDNSESHFDPIKDSFKIYFILFRIFLKYFLSSISSMIVDLIAFQIFLSFFSLTSLNHYILFSTICARSISSIYNFSINRKLVFHSLTNKYIQIALYFSLVIVQGFTSGYLVEFLFPFLKFNILTVKIIVDSVLFFLSFKVQKKWVFR